MLNFTVTKAEHLKQLSLFLPLFLPSKSGIIQAYSIATTEKKEQRQQEAEQIFQFLGKWMVGQKFQVLCLEMCPKITHSE